MVKELLSLMPPHTRYCEAFFGGGAFLLNKPCEGIAEFANDLNGDLMNFWRVLRGSDFGLFKKWCDLTPFSRPEFEELDSRGRVGKEDVYKAWRFFVRNRQSRQGLGRDFATPTSRTRRGMNENVSAWLSAVDGLPEIYARLRRVEIRCQDAKDFIRELDSPETLFYCDPPYMHDTRSSTGEYGEQEMDRTDHEALLHCLKKIEGKFMLSGYLNEVYDVHAREAGWRRKDFDRPNQASSKREKERKTECVWMNY